MRATFHVPIAFAAVPQQPTSTSDKPAPAGAPQQPTASAGAPSAPAGQPQQQPCGTEMWIMMPAMLLIMYFMVIRPDQKRRKDQQNLLAAVKVGDRVVTVGGLHGVIAKLADKTVTLKIDGVQATFDRVAIARVERDDASAQTKA
ncbi:MAG: preprotein translocase subunit YajC [Phycisphaerales bacterium]|jgi:preprotein translocase subunit YajC|nr:preprotein translocase subunit YajC [Phycisphaerales bacterium]